MGYSFGFGGVNFFFALLAMRSIDIIGRRRWLLSTLPMMSVFLMVSAISYALVDKSAPPEEYNVRGAPESVAGIVFIYLFAAVYSPGLGPIPFTLASESFSLEHREAHGFTGLRKGGVDMHVSIFTSSFHHLDSLTFVVQDLYSGSLTSQGWLLVIVVKEWSPKPLAIPQSPWNLAPGSPKPRAMWRVPPWATSPLRHEDASRTASTPSTQAQHLHNSHPAALRTVSRMAPPQPYQYGNQEQYTAPPPYAYQPPYQTYAPPAAPRRRSPRANCLVITARQFAIIVPVVIIVLNIWWSIRDSSYCPSSSDNAGGSCYLMLWLSLPIAIVSCLWGIATNISARRATHGMSHIPLMVNVAVQLMLAIGATVCFIILVIEIQGQPTWSRYTSRAMAGLLAILMIINWIMFGWTAYETHVDRRERRRDNSQIPL
ncbi:hypothetical protein FZEAL_3594 [Fusarium zealandicum]|uniref:Uncharacterized protein n=1 Tax=Fusarium zealandicum TaxID=1053134 RepID=A0A8H4UNC9_9HYPO|nr:hypothetical protein FZEAL_3594 [Fusarium zealandicum]